jgi:hypothetical protein
MSVRLWVVGALLAASGLIGCGGSSHATTSTAAGASSTSSSTSSQGASSSAQAPAEVLAAANALHGLPARLLRAGEFTGYDPLGPPVRGASADSWVVAAEYPPRERAAAAATLRRLGFVAAMRERLQATNGQGSEAISVVHQFRTPAGAQADLANEAKLAAGEKAFSIAGIPGARGFGGSSNESSGQNVAFAKGSYFYLVGMGAPSGVALPSLATLTTAATHLYNRVH